MFPILVVIMIEMDFLCHPVIARLKQKYSDGSRLGTLSGKAYSEVSCFTDKSKVQP